MKSGTLAIIGSAVGAVGARALKAPFPPPGANQYLDLIASHDPGLLAALRVWHHAWPAVLVVLAGSFALSVWRVWLQPLFRPTRRGRLPEWPASPADEAPSLVIGELHHPTVPEESEQPSWLVIPEKGLYTGTLIVGAVGTLVQTLRTRIFLSLSDEASARIASEMCGSVMKTRASYTFTETTGRPEFSLLSGRAGGGRGTIGASKSFRRQSEPVFTPREFGLLANYQAVCLPYDGVKSLPATRVYLKPHYLPRETGYWRLREEGRI